MASTRQSALEYITNGRRRLIGRLQNLPLIVENLFQRKVLHEEEVSKIQAEVDHFDQTRKILDWVSAKGEVACYELLTILDITRKRTLDDADLQQWISCFPFEEDPEMTDYLVGSKPCHRYQTQLKCKARKITEGAWTQSCSLLPERCRNDGTFSYTPLVLDTDVCSSLSKIKMKNKKCKKARPKKLKSFIPLAKQETSPADLLKTHENKILLVGKPGIGKTSVTHQMLNLWAEKDHRELDYMFYFDVRDISHRKAMSLEDLLFNMYSEPNESKEEVLQDIKKNSENVVIIFDGITDLSSLSVVKDLVENLLPDAKVVTTCRPDQSEDFLTDWPTDWFRVEVKGFSDESIRAYLTQMLSAEPDSLSSVLNNLELFSLCHVPMYALMVVACIYFPTSVASKQTCTITEMYINILRHCIQKHSGKRLEDHNKCLKKNREKILSLAEIAFDATNEKNMNLTTLSCEESSVHFAFLGAFMVNISPTESFTCAAFLHYTMQEFFGALWLLQNPDKIREVLEKCQTEEWKHTKHLIPFLCGLLNERNTRLVNSLVPAEQIKKTSDWFFKEVVNTFLPSQTNQDHAEGGAPESEKDLLFLCQCLYEYQSTEACLLLLDKLDYHLDLSGEHLDPHQCCAVSYVTSQSAERKVGLDLNGCTVSDQGVRLILGSLKNVRHLGPSSDDSSDPSMLCQLWTTLLSSEAEMDFTSLLGICGNELHLPVQGEGRVFERAEEVMKQSLERVHLCVHWDQRTVLSKALSKTILKCLPNINKLRFTPLQHQRGSPERLETEEKAVLLDLCLQAALDHTETFQRTVNTLLSLFSVYQTERYDILLDLYSHVKYNRNQTARSILPSWKPLYQSAPAVWSIDLSERKASLLLEVLKLQPGKKPVELKDWSDEESEVRSFLQCLPYISQLRFSLLKDIKRTNREKTFLLNLCLQAALHERETIQTAVEKVLSLSKVYHNQKCDFLLDLFSHVKDYETQTGRSVLPALQPVYQSASPAVWSIDLSERKASLLLEVLKLQPEQKPVELKDWSDEESEVRSFLQCLPYISQLSFTPPQDQRRSPEERTKRERTFLLNLCLQAALHERETIQTTVEKVLSLSKVNHNQKCDFLLDLFSHVKGYETQTGRRVLPALQTVYQSASPAIWSIVLSERKASLLLEVLKLQPEKKPVELKGWSDEESEVRSFLQCLPYISQLSFCPRRSDSSKQIKFLVDLLSQAAEWEEQTGEKTLKLVSSVCTYSTFPYRHGDNSEQSDFLLDLYSHVRDYETQTGRSVLPALQAVYQSARPAVWSIDLRKRKASLLLEVLKLQPEKKPVELKSWSDEESEVRSFLQCLPYISQLSFCPWRSVPSKQIKFLVDLLSQAAEWEEQTGEKTLKLVSSVWTYSTFPFPYGDSSEQSDFLIDLFSHVKDYETQTGRSFLPALQPVYQSAPAVWSIDLSERKASLLLEVLKLQPEKKPVELMGWSEEESVVRSFLQCLPYISQLCFHPWRSDPSKQIKFLVDLLSQAAEWEEQTGEKTLKLVSSVCTYRTFPFLSGYNHKQSDFLLDLFSHVKDYETQTGSRVLPALQTVYQSAPAVWSIDLSERKASLLLEVLKLQPEKKPVELKGWSDEESEVRSFLQCLPYISQLSFTPSQGQRRSPEERRKRERTFLLNLCLQAALHERETIQTTVEKVLSLSKVHHNQKCDFLLDLFSHVKDYETQTGRRVLPALQPVYQSAPAVWSIDLSERKTSRLLEVLKLQPEKKPVELKDWSDEESEVRSFLQCLPYISQLSFHPWWSDPSKQIKFLVDLLSQAAEWEEQTGEKTLKLVSSVWTYSTFPYHYGDNYKQSDSLLDLYSHVKDYETQTGRSVLPALQTVYQSAPAVWSIDLRKRKAYLLLEVLKLQPEKKPVELKGWSDEESEVRSFLQCLSYISQLSFCPVWSDPSKQIKFLVDLLSQAAEWEEQTGEKTLKLVSSVCTYSTFPFHYGDNYKQSDFLLDLYSHVRDYETQTGRSFLPALQAVYQSARPAVWSIDLRKRKASLLLEVLKLQPEKKPVELKSWSDEESEVRSFLQCLPYISQLSCGDDRFFQTVCESIPVRSREEDQQLASLLQALGSTLSLGGELPRKTCRSVGRVLGLCASRVDLTLTPSKISLQGAALLLRHESKLHKLRLSVGVAVKLSRLVRRTGRGATPLTVPELSLVLKSSQPPERVLSRALSSVASLLRLWRVQCLDLTDFCIQGHSLITLLCHQGPLSLRLNSETLQQLTVVVYEAQDKDLTQWFLEKVGGDLTSCRLDWEVLLSLMQHSTHNITVDLRKNRLLEKNSSDLLPFLGRVTLKRSSSSFVKSSIRQIYDSRASDCVSSLLSSSDHWINLNSRELDRVDCTALCFTLLHSHQVKVNLLWTSIPPGEIESILPLLDRVSQLSVDRRLLLSFLQCCAASQIHQGAPPLPTAVWLLRSLHYRLDFSCSSSVDLSAQDQGEALCLTTDHCRAINSVLKQNQHGTPLVQNQVQIILRDCEVEDRALRELLPILNIVKLSPSKALLLQLLYLVCEGIEEGLLRHAESLCRALDGELDLSETRLDQKACGSLALVLEHSEGLSELDLSHCQLTDHQLQPLITHLHKVQVLDLSHNDITDALTDRILQLVSTNTSIHTVRLFNNRIQDRRPFLTDKRFDIW
ncbi:uncharacterized protein LOC110510945 [Oncorhynchus mykiss]|uniref:uncharacterized protein LOC110510945 n=1 Tax=Oncorhynchus mykiss TaxID=8022 RepID=UPI0018777BA4|nr:uncharacterized protein LOC110510945 [Oncorhynchus mykiss]